MMMEFAAVADHVLILPAASPFSLSLINKARVAYISARLLLLLVCAPLAA